MCFYKLLLLIILNLIICSCSEIPGNDMIVNRNREYLSARNEPPLNIPPGVSSSTIEAHYPVSTHEYPGRATEVDLTPPGLN